jgi:NADPH-dependent curcumin reductase CurA
MSVAAREIHLKSRPFGLPASENFELTERRLPSPSAGQLLVRTLVMSVDPYMRGRMIDRPSYIAPFRIGEALEGCAIGIVEETGATNFKQGDLVSHFAGWRDYALIDAATAGKIDTASAPVQAWLGPLGVPGHTAYAGLLRIAALQEGETVFVSAAGGAVGSMAAQIAKIKGGKIIGSVGSEEKARWLKDELGADAVINYRTAGDLTEALAKAAPDGIDVYFDNVGGEHLEAAIAVANPFARFALCGMIAQYNDGTLPPGPRNIYTAVIKSLTLHGFKVLDPMNMDLLPDFTRDMRQWIAEGRIKWRETIVEGLENAPQAFIGLFAGENVGKMLVKIADA